MYELCHCVVGVVASRDNDNDGRMVGSTFWREWPSTACTKWLIYWQSPWYYYPGRFLIFRMKKKEEKLENLEGKGK